MKYVLNPRGPTHQARRPDIARLWHILETEVAGPDDRLARDFLHLKAGAPVSDAYDWFMLANLELDGREPPVVEVRYRRFLWTRTISQSCRVLTFRHGKAFFDGEEVRALKARTIVGVRWTSGRGHVETQVTDHTEKLVESGRYIRLRGIINGVHTHVVV